MADMCNNIIEVSGAMPMNEIAETAVRILKEHGYSNPFVSTEKGKVVISNVESKWIPATRTSDEDGAALTEALRQAKLSFRNYYEELGSDEYGCHVVDGERDIEVALTERELSDAEEQGNSERYAVMDVILEHKLQEQGL